MKTMNLAMVAMLSMGTALTTLGKTKSAYASLTPPVAYDYSYTWNATDSEQYLNANGFDTIPLYTRTADGAYYDYVSTFNVIDGLDVTMDFQRSNTLWQASGTKYKPDENKIGSDNTVGTISRKISLYFNNQTNKNYLLFIDVSSTSSVYNLNYILEINGLRLQDNNNLFNWIDNDFFLILYLPSYSILEFYSPSDSRNQNFDAWYLRDLGTSQSYEEGYDANRTGILTDYLGTDAQQIGWVLLGIAAIIFVFKGGK
jgi:hypothetical protein